MTTYAEMAPHLEYLDSDKQKTRNGVVSVDETCFKVGENVKKVGGDYRFDGVVVAAFQKLSGLVRYVVEDDRGILHVFAASHLQIRPKE